MFRRVGLLLCWGAALASSQDTILWNSDTGSVNLMSGGELMDGAFRFELGVFQGAFVPTPANQSEWASQWSAARRTLYNASTKRFADSFGVSNNASPFTLGKTAWIWGFRGSAVSGEWILFRASGWNWPGAASFPPSFHEWFARDATPVVGKIHPGGSPWLMQSAAVSGAPPPPTSWVQWKSEELAGEPLDGTMDDPDRDGVSNLLEFVFGTPPRTAGPPPTTPVSLVQAAGRSHAQIHLPRRIDRPAVLTVEVSDGLAAWQSGPGFTVVVSDDPLALTVRDLTPLTPAAPRRFLRLKVRLP